MSILPLMWQWFLLLLWLCISWGHIIAVLLLMTLSLKDNSAKELGNDDSWLFDNHHLLWYTNVCTPPYSFKGPSFANFCVWVTFKMRSPHFIYPESLWPLMMEEFLLWWTDNWQPTQHTTIHWRWSSIWTGSQLTGEGRCSVFYHDSGWFPNIWYGGTDY